MAVNSKKPIHEQLRSLMMAAASACLNGILFKHVGQIYDYGKNESFVEVKEWAQFFYVCLMIAHTSTPCAALQLHAVSHAELRLIYMLI